MDETEYVFRPPGQPIKTKCAVLGCDNRMGSGLFHGFLCAPCHGFISTGEGVYSQAYRNMQTRIDAEREACAKVCDELANGIDSACWEGAETAADAIRAREKA